MIKDSIVEEVRKNRSEILKQFDGDMLKHHEELKKLQGKYKDKLVTLEPKKKFKRAS